MNTLESFLAWVVGAILAAWVLGWLFNRALSQAAYFGNEALNRIEAHLPRMLLPLEHLALVFLLVGISAVVLTFPNATLWAFVTAGTIDLQRSTSMLGASAALLALLLFAANQVRAFEKDSVTSERYLGVNVDMFPVLRSRVVRSMGLPLFQFIVALLFALPLLLLLVPEVTRIPAFFSFPGASIEPRHVTLSVWVACFTLVGVTLLLNVVGTLRKSTSGILRPWAARHSIEHHFERQSNSAYSEFVRGPSRDRYHFIEQWAYEHIQESVALPAGEQLKYLQLTIGSSAYLRARQKRLDRYFELSRRIAHTETAGSAPDDVPDGSFRSWRYRRRVTQATEALERAHWLALGRSRAMLRALGALDGSKHQDVQNWLVEQCVRTAEYADAECQEILGMNPTEASTECDSSADGRIARARSVLLQPSNRIPTLDSRDYWHQRGQAEPEIEFIPAFVFRSLLELLLRPSSCGLPARAGSGSIKRILDGVGRLRDERTREYGLQDAIEAVLKKTIMLRAEGETLEPAMIESWLTSQEHVRVEEGKPGSPRRAPEDIAETVAFRLLAQHGKSTSKALNEMLVFIEGWRVPAILLFLLFYGHRSHSPITTDSLSSFRRKLDSPGQHEVDIAADIERCTQFIRNSNVSHFVNEDGVAWLYNALERPLSLELLVEFLEVRDQRVIMNFDLLQFVQWRTLAGPARFNFATPPDFRASDEHLRALEREAPRLRRFADEWRIEDSHGAEAVDLLLHMFPRSPAAED